MQAVSSSYESKTRASQVLARGQAASFFGLAQLAWPLWNSMQTNMMVTHENISSIFTWEECTNITTPEHSQSGEAPHLLQSPGLLHLNVQGQ